MNAVVALSQVHQELLYTDLVKRAQAWLLTQVEPFGSPTEYLQQQLQTQDDLQSFSGFIVQLDLVAKQVFDDQEWPDRGHVAATTWPAPPKAGAHIKVPVLLNQFAFGEGSSPRGPANLCDVIDIVDTNFTKGAKTAKYPIEIFPLTAVVKDQPIEVYSVGQLVGVGTTAASFLCIWAMVNLDKWWPVNLKVQGPEGSWSPGVQPCLISLLALGGPHLSSIWRLHASWDLTTNTLGVIQSSLGAKIAATSRQRPHPVQMMRALGLRARELTATSSRKSAVQIWDSAIAEFQKGQSRSHKLTTDEMTAIKLLARSDQQFVDKLGRIWSLEKMSYTSVPLNLVSAKFLLEETDTGADPIGNPMWFKIFAVNEEKKWFWLQRVHGRFTAKVDCRKGEKTRVHARSACVCGLPVGNFLRCWRPLIVGKRPASAIMLHCTVIRIQLQSGRPLACLSAPCPTWQRCTVQTRQDLSL